MNRKLWAALLALTLLTGALPPAGADETAAMTIAGPEGDIRPGKNALLTFTLPEAAQVAIAAETPAGDRLALIAWNAEAAAGPNWLYWNAMEDGEPLPAGPAVLRLTAGGASVTAPVTIGQPAPYIAGAAADRRTLTPANPTLRVTGTLSEPGTVRIDLMMVDEGERLFLTETEIEMDALDLLISADDALGEMLAEGSYRLELTLIAGGEQSDPVTVAFAVSDSAEADAAEEAAPAETQTVSADADFGADELILEDLEADALPESTVPAQAASFPEDGVDPDEVILDDAEPAPAPTAAPAQGTLPGEGELFFLAGNDQRQYTPSHGSPYEGRDTSVNYWTLPMDITDEEAVWNMLMSPITVVDNGKNNAQRLQVTIRREPDANSDGVGVVTCISQGVHVLEVRDEWALIECYSASFHDSSVKAWNMLVQGWIPSRYLRTVTPDPSMGIVVDKLTQRLYIFRDGRLYDTLLISTGKVNAKQPYNETRSGEFLLMVPAVGGFSDGSMICSMAIRFNGGDLLHEVPHSENSAGEKYYGTYEPALGTKASHGCIRDQRRRTPLGTNMAWIWKNKKNNTRIVIWEDWQGRQILPPSDDTLVYYNPRGGSMYHACETCYSASGKTFTAFTYGELEDQAYRRLTRCTWCNPPLRLREIAEINRVYIPGGDHDPQLTAARIKQGFIVEGSE